ADERSRLPTTWSRTPRLWIQDREHATLEFLPSRHGERDHRGAIAAHGSNDVEQMLGVIRRTRAAHQGQIIARTLALGAQALCCRPDQRMKPVHSARDAAECMTDQIPAAHVRELVQQYRAAALRRPSLALDRK